MPFTWRFFHKTGSVFTNALSAPPLCCPSRAGFLTGDYAQNHGVLTNDSGYSHLTQKENTLPVWLGRARYRTAVVGKYLNGFPALHSTPPGWDDFFGSGGGLIDYVDFDVGVNGEPRHYGGHRYSTAVYTKAAERFLRSTARQDQASFLWLTYNAPHTVPDGAPPCPGINAQPQTAADYRRFAHARLPRTPALHERDVSDKGRWIRRHGPASPRELTEVTDHWRCALSSLPAVDRGFRSIVNELRRLGELDRTIIVFTSDNGYFYGEHGVADDKLLAYDPALRVPLAISVPPGLGGGQSPSRISALVSNVDLAPTILDYSHVRPCKNGDRCRTVDGRSLRPLLAGDRAPWTKNRAIPIELKDDFTYKALRTPGLLYVKLVGDPLGRLRRPEIELYDLHNDPFQLHNLWAEDRAANRARQRRLATRLHALTQCSGTRGAGACP